MGGVGLFVCGVDIDLPAEVAKVGCGERCVKGIGVGDKRDVEGDDEGGRVSWFMTDGR